MGEQVERRGIDIQVTWQDGLWNEGATLLVEDAIDALMASLGSQLSDESDPGVGMNLSNSGADYHRPTADEFRQKARRGLARFHGPRALPIVMALASTDPTDSTGLCCLCARVAGALNDHADACPWRLAYELMSDITP